MALIIWVLIHTIDIKYRLLQKQTQTCCQPSDLVCEKLVKHPDWCGSVDWASFCKVADSSPSQGRCGPVPG